jgi:hypothetical protein
VKKAISVVLALVFCFSMLSGCGDSGGGSTTTAEPPAPTPSASATPEQSRATPSATTTTTPSTEPPTTHEPDPEPEPETKTVTLTSPDFGDISFSYLDDGKTIVELADPGTETLAAIEAFYMVVRNETRRRFSYSSAIQYEKAHITTEGVHIVLGYSDYANTDYFMNLTYDALLYSRTSESIPTPEIEYGGLVGYAAANNSDKIFTLFFPAITQHGARVITIYPDDLTEDILKELRNTNDWIELGLLELPQVKAILDTLDFGGKALDEERWETQPIDVPEFTLTPVDGWEVYEHNSNPAPNVSYFRLKNEEIERKFPNVAPSIYIEVRPDKTPQEQLDETLKGDWEKVADVTIGGRRYAAVQSTQDSFRGNFVLITSIGASTNMNEPGYIYILTRNTVDLDQAKSLIETIVFK